MNDGGTNTVEIKVEGVYKAFDSDPVLAGVDLTVRRGDILAIVGESGCGKTVLVEIMTGQMDPDRGRVLVANHEIPDAPLLDLAELDEPRMEQIRRHWAIVFQRNALLSGTVMENIGLWLREVHGLDERAIAERARTALEAVGLDPDEVLDEDRDELSGGMAKRVAIARAIALRPVLIFYDEPTTGLDPIHAARIHDLIHEIHHSPHDEARGRTTILITHDRELLWRLRPDIIMLHEGRVFFDGTYEDFSRSTSPIIRPYFESMPVLQRRRPSIRPPG